MTRNSRRRIVTPLRRAALCALSVVVALIPLAFILFFVLSRGIQALNWNFFTQLPTPVGEPGGGMANAIVGTVMLTGLGGLFAIPIGIIGGIYMSEYAGTSSLRPPVRRRHAERRASRS